MLRKIIMWTIFALFSAGIITWLTFLIIDAAKSESMRWGAKKIRAERALKAEGPIIIGVAGGRGGGYSTLLDGVELALEEINRAGGVLGRPLEIDPRDDRMTAATGMKVAQDFADNLDMVAVIGHITSTVSMSTAVIYEYYGLLMLSPLSSNPALTSQGRRLVFRNIPTDEAAGLSLAEHAARQNYRRVAIYYLQDDYSRGLANIFERSCYEQGITIVDRLPYESNYKESDFKADFDLWQRQFDFDAILLAGLLPQAGEIIKYLRRAGINAPILSAGGFDSELLLEVAGKYAEGVVFTSTFDPEAEQPLLATFVKAYQDKYGNIPDMNAAQGYDALHLLAHVIREGGSTVPEKMAATLRQVKNWQGVTGPHTFDDKGDVIGKPMVIKTIKDGRFKVVPQQD